VEHAAAFAAVEDVTTFHSFRRFVRSYEVERGFGRISYTKRAANPVVASDCRVLPEQLLSSSPVLISLALSLALTSSGICNSFQYSNLELEARVGIGHFPPQLHAQYARFYRLIKYNLHIPAHTLFNTFGVRFGVRWCPHESRVNRAGKNIRATVAKEVAQGMGAEETTATRIESFISVLNLHFFVHVGQLAAFQQHAAQ
ncbi:MAG: hypothetical protein ABSD29_15770, partial [Verrucomicrobiota bacterium]